MEKSAKLKATSTVMGAALIVGGVMAAVPSVASAQVSVEGLDAQAAFSQDASELGLANQAFQREGVRTVEGSFSFTQDAVTSNEAISSIFQKAAATLCQTMPDYAASEAVATAIEVSAPQTSFAATVEEMAGDEDFGAIVGCACATNAPGGGAIANAEVQGVALAAIATMAQVL